ncbi:MAG TPA: hypothetical protein VMU05_12720 [Dongiaceae bacterium]|nr:hypothetical protein [Dongiaceae bacterium]
MGRSAFRGLVSCVLTVLFPLSLFGADSNAAMLYASGHAWINGSHVPRPSLAIFSGDLLQTRSDSVADINQPGSTIRVFADSLVQFQGTSVSIDHGGVMVSTSKKLATTAGDVKVSPLSDNWTEFSVIDDDGTVKIAARKGDVSINDGKQTTTLAQGQETTRDENSSPSTDNNRHKNRKRQAGAMPGAKGGILNSPIAIGVGGAAVLTIVGLGIFRDDDPVSPSKP